MFKTLKTILAGILAAVIVIAIGASVYTAFAAPGTNIFSGNLNPLQMEMAMAETEQARKHPCWTSPLLT